MNKSNSPYIVRVYATPMSFPLNFTFHTRIEISGNDQTERYDLWAYPGLKTSSKNQGYIYKDIFPDHLGTTFSPLANTDFLEKRQSGKILYEISSSRNVLATELYKKIQAQAFAYPYAETYKMIMGPNCNTYTQWLLDLIPELKVKLPWYAWGKNYKM